MTHMSLHTCSALKHRMRHLEVQKLIKLDDPDSILWYMFLQSLHLYFYEPWQKVHMRAEIVPSQIVITEILMKKNVYIYIYIYIYLLSIYLSERERERERSREREREASERERDARRLLRATRDESEDLSSGPSLDSMCAFFFHLMFGHSINYTFTWWSFYKLHFYF